MGRSWCAASSGFLPAFYVHRGLLHATLSTRVDGDLAAVPAAVRWGGLLNVVTLLVFVANTVVAVATAAGVGAQEALRSGP